MLQQKSPVISLAAVRLGFDYVIKTVTSSDMKKYLEPNAKIVYSATFENTLVELQNRQESFLNDDEKESIKIFKNSTFISEEAGDVLSAIQNVPKCELQYQSTSWISPTSNMCESFFSKVKHAFDDYRRSTFAKSMEEIMFAKCNYRLWTNSKGEFTIKLDVTQNVAEPEGQAKRNNFCNYVLIYS